MPSSWYARNAFMPAMQRRASTKGHSLHSTTKQQDSQVLAPTSLAVKDHASLKKSRGVAEKVARLNSGSRGAPVDLTQENQRTKCLPPSIQCHKELEISQLTTEDIMGCGQSVTTFSEASYARRNDVLCGQESASTRSRTSNAPSKGIAPFNQQEHRSATSKNTMRNLENASLRWKPTLRPQGSKPLGSRARSGQQTPARSSQCALRASYTTGYRPFSQRSAHNSKNGRSLSTSVFSFKPSFGRASGGDGRSQSMPEHGFDSRIDDSSSQRSCSGGTLAAVGKSNYLDESHGSVVMPNNRIMMGDNRSAEPLPPLSHSAYSQVSHSQGSLPSTTCFVTHNSTAALLKKFNSNVDLKMKEFDDTQHNFQQILSSAEKARLVQRVDLDTKFAKVSKKIAELTISAQRVQETMTDADNKQKQYARDLKTSFKHLDTKAKEATDMYTTVLDVVKAAEASATKMKEIANTSVASIKEARGSLVELALPYLKNPVSTMVQKCLKDFQKTTTFEQNLPCALDNSSKARAVETRSQTSQAAISTAIASCYVVGVEKKVRPKRKAANRVSEIIEQYAAGQKKQTTTCKRAKKKLKTVSNSPTAPVAVVTVMSSKDRSSLSSPPRKLTLSCVTPHKQKLHYSAPIPSKRTRNRGRYGGRARTSMKIFYDDERDSFLSG